MEFSAEKIKLRLMNSEFQKLMEEGNEFFDKKNYAEAAEKYEQALEHAQSDSEKFVVFMSWGQALAKQNKYTESIEKFEAAKSFAKNNDDKYLTAILCGRSFTYLKKYYRASKEFEAAYNFAQSDKDKFKAKFESGLAVGLEDKHSEAIKKFQSARIFAGSTDEFGLNLCWGITLTEQQKYQESIQKFKVAEEFALTEKEKKQVYSLLFRTYQKGREFNKAEEYQKRLDKIDPNWISAEERKELIKGIVNSEEEIKNKEDFLTPLERLNDSSYSPELNNSEYERLKQKRIDSRVLGWFFKFLYWSPELFSTVVTLLIISFVIGWQLFSGHSWKVSFQSAPFIVLFALVLVTILRDFTKTGFVYEEKRWKWILIGLIGFSFISLEEQFPGSVKTPEGLVETSTESVKVSEASVKTPEGLVKRSKESVETSEASNLLLGKSIEYWQLHLLLIFAISFSAWQYLTAKRLRIDTQNRIAMARMLMANQTMFKDQETRDANNSQIVRIVAKNVFKKEGSPAVELKTPVVSAKANI